MVTVLDPVWAHNFEGTRQNGPNNLRLSGPGQDGAGKYSYHF